jgi:hypothetical protein
MAPEATVAARRRALLVATATYGDPGLASLRAPAGDVAALAGVLRDEAIGAFEVDALVDRPTEDVKREIEEFFEEARRDDLLLLYFSGHGVLSGSRRFYFATTTTKLKWLRATAIDDGFVNEVMQHSRARSIVLVLDCCHSGAFGKGLAPKGPLTVDVEHRFEGQGRVTLSASTELEYAFEETDTATGINPSDPGSLFTRALVEGLASGEADLNGDGRIAVDELYDYLYARMREGPGHQTPGIAGDMRGDIVIARSTRVAPAPPAIPPPAAPVAPPPAGARARPRIPRWAFAAAVPLVAGVAVAVVLLGGSGGSARRPYDFLGNGRQAVVIAPVNAKSPEILIHPGSTDGKPQAISADAAGLSDAASDSLFGSGIASGDFDHDGHVDLAVGASGLNALAVLYGSADGVTDGEPVDGPGPAGQYGWSLVAADFNDDAYADLAVGAIGAGSESGAIEVLFGSADGLRTTGATTLTAPAGVPDSFGSVLAAGDVDGDGDIDLVEGAQPSDDPRVANGHFTWCPGAARGPQKCTVLPGRDGDSGTTALAIADLDHDGTDDVVQGDVTIPQGGGGLRVWLGGEHGPGPTPAILTPTKLRMHNPALASDGAGFGASLDAGRIDGDDYADIVVGIPGYGGIAIVRGGPDEGYAHESPRLVRAPAGASHFGSSVSLLHLRGGGDPPDVAVAADEADLGAAVWAVHGDEVRALGGLAGAVDGSAQDVDLGRDSGS